MCIRDSSTTTPATFPVIPGCCPSYVCRCPSTTTPATFPVIVGCCPWYADTSNNRRNTAIAETIYHSLVRATSLCYMTWHSLVTSDYLMNCTIMTRNSKASHYSSLFNLSGYISIRSGRLILFKYSFKSAAIAAIFYKISYIICMCVCII